MARSSASPRPDASEAAVSAVRAFNRFYTRKIGVLEEGLLKTKFSLAELRVLYELSNRDQPTATALAADLGLDAGYLSRILTRFKGLGFVSRRPSDVDARQSLLSLTAKGKTEFAKLNTRSNREIEELLEPLETSERAQIVDSMQTIERLLNPIEYATRTNEPFILRSHRVGDMGIIVSRQALLYAKEYGWDERFEALVAKIAAQFIEEFDPARDRCWIAERAGEVVGAVFLVKASGDLAKLRMLYVEPKVRGMGIGKRLVEECIRFGRECKYKKVTLWTQSILLSARSIYERNGFKLVKQYEHRDFGFDLTGENWELEL